MRAVRPRAAAAAQAALRIDVWFLEMATRVTIVGAALRPNIQFALCHALHRPHLERGQMPSSSRKRSTGTDEPSARMRHRPTPVHWKRTLQHPGAIAGF